MRKRKEAEGREAPVGREGYGDERGRQKRERRKGKGRCMEGMEELKRGGTRVTETSVWRREGTRGRHSKKVNIRKEEKEKRRRREMKKKMHGEQEKKIWKREGGKRDKGNGRQGKLRKEENKGRGRREMKQRKIKENDEIEEEREER